MTKKCKLVLFGILSLLLCASVALGVFGLSLANAEAPAVESEQAPAATYCLGVTGTDTADTFYYATHIDGWKAAVAKAKEVYSNADGGNYVKVILDADWTAGTGWSGFGDSLIVLSVPKETRITIDLNGNTINHNLINTNGLDGGRVFDISGELTIDDSVGDGQITGAYNNAGTRNATGGAVNVRAGATFVLNGGIITGNKVCTSSAAQFVAGAGVYCEGTFIMNGGSITNNGVTNMKTNYGGGVCVASNGTFNMKGGTISGNTATLGGGLCVKDTGTANITGGNFENNKAIAGTGGATGASIGGGAICAYSNANLTIENCTINGNFAENYGGGIFYAVSSANTLTINNCKLTNNVVAANGDVSGGALAAVRTNNGTTAIEVNIDGDGTLIENNKAIRIGGSGLVFGGGIFVHRCTLNLKGGNVGGEKGNSVFTCGTAYTCNGNVSDDVKAINDWLNDLDSNISMGGYGGGICINSGSNADVKGTLNMSGGFVQNNTASYGGGLYNSTSVVNLSGGSVTHNVGVSGGGGLYSTSNGVIQLSGNPVMTENTSENTERFPNGSCNMHLNDDNMLEIIENGLTDGAEIGITAYSKPEIRNRARAFTRGYSDYENKYFTSDRDDWYIFCNENGQLVYSSYDLKWEIDGEKTNTQVLDCRDGNEKADTTRITYNGDPVEFFKNGVGVSGDIILGGTYTATAAVGETGVKSTFKIIVPPLQLVTDGPNKNLYAQIVGSDEFFRTGNPIKPQVSVYVQLSNGNTFNPVCETEYINNVEVGTATAKVTVSPTDAYSSASIELTFTIVKPIDEAEYTINWQYYNGNAWRNISDADKPDFTYNGSDFSNRIRAELSYGKYNTIYATKGGSNSLFALEIDEMINASTYTVKAVPLNDCTISGSDSGADKLEVEVKQLNLDIVVGDFTATDGVRQLWLLDGSEYLLSAITYNVDGAAVIGTEPNYYVRYTASEKTIALNEAYTVKGYSIAQLIDLGAKVKYTDASATGEVNAFNKINTEVTITFTDNFANVETIVITKEWAIVTINNGLFDESGKAYSVSGFTYGADATISAPRPERGDSVTVVIPAASAFDPVLMDVEIVYSADGYTLYVDSIETNKTLAEFITGLKLNAGTYTLEVTYDGDGENYFTATQSYQFVVARLEITDGDLVFDNSAKTYTGTTLQPEVTKSNPESDVTFSCNYLNNVNVGTATVVVTGTGNYTGTKLFNFEITAGANEWKTRDVKGWTYGEFTDKCINITAAYGYVHWEVTDSKGVVVGNLALADAGRYTLTASVAPTGNYSGLDKQTFTFDITKADNGWTVLPSIIEWKYDSFDINTNVVLGTPYFGTPKFKIQDADDNDLTDAFELNGGLVPDSIKDILAKLHYGRYKLVATVAASDNYGPKTDTVTFIVAKGTNDWKDTFDVISWSYGSYKKDSNPILGSVISGTVTFSVTKGGTAVKGLESFTTVNDTIAELLSGLAAGDYAITATVTVDDNYEGLNTQTVNFTVAKGANDWKVPFDVINWSYGGFDKDTNRIMGSVINGTVTFAVLKDGVAVAGLEGFTEVDDAIASKLAALVAGNYKVTATVTVDDNYMAVNKGEVTLNVAKAKNTWADGEGDLVLPSWVVGKFDPAVNEIVVKAAYGEAIIEIRDMEDNVYYNSLTPEKNTLNDLDVGKYLLVARVLGGDNYDELPERTFTIEVLDKIGLPWWGTTLIAVGALALAAVIILILWKAKVFEILTDTISLAITTRATVDATIAAVRATKKAEEAEAHKRKVEAAERLQAAREAYRNKTPEQRAQDLQDKADATATRATEMHAKADKMRERADKLTGKAEQKEADAEPTDTPIDEVPTEE